MKMDVFLYEAMHTTKWKNTKIALQNYWKRFNPYLTISRNENHALHFLVTPFSVKVIRDGYPVGQPLVTDRKARSGSKNSVGATLQLSSSDRFQKVNTQSLKQQ